MVRGAQRVLVIEPDRSARAAFDRALDRLGIAHRVAPDAEAGWAAFAADRPTVVLCALHTEREGGDWFVRRLQTEYMGPMPQVFLICGTDDITRELQPLEIDGVLVPPISSAALAAIAGAVVDIGDTAARQAARLRELYELTTLGGDTLPALDTLVARTALTFRASDCVLWGPAHEPHWPRTARRVDSPEREALLLWRCDLALNAGTTVLFSDGADTGEPIVDAPPESYLAAPIELPGGEELGALCLVDTGPRRFSADERDALRVLARRLSIELAWTSAHNRLVEEHEKLRESSLLDPLLGVWTRSALESALHSEIAGAQRRGETLSVAVLDLDQLRQINDRYGHVAGDAALAHFAEVARARLRTQDIIGRFGGDEIAVLLTQTSLDEAQALIEDVAAAVRDTPLVHHGLQIGIGCAAGLTSVQPDETTGEPAFGRAVAALRRARRMRVPVAIIDPTGQSRDELRAVDAELDDIGVLPAGSTLGGMYRVLHEISRGAMGVVYRGEDLGLARPVAIKVLRADLAQDDELVAKFRDEAAMLASLHHPNLVQVYSFGTHGDDVFFVMELVEGEPTSELLRAARETGHGLPLAETARIASEVAGALHAMHGVGLIHRDVKPSNILVDRIRDRAVLVDVGVAKRRDDATDAAGTPGFAAPESFMDVEETPATDVYGLASTVYLLLTGIAPFGSGEIERVVHRQLYDAPTPPSQLRPDLPEAVDTVLLRALHPDQRKRYATAVEFADALQRAAAQAGDAHDGRSNRIAATARALGVDIDEATSRLRAAPGAPGTPLTARRGAVAGPRASGQHVGGQTRGALFRVAYRVLSTRLGADWLAALRDRHAELRPVLDPALSPMVWLPLDHLRRVLAAAADTVQEPAAFAEAIGRATMTATFSRFFGASPHGVPTAKVLRAAEGYWSRYHTWGSVRAEQVAPGQCVLSVADSPGDRLLCALLAGSFTRIAELTGAARVTTDHVECTADGHARCRFRVRWDDGARR